MIFTPKDEGEAVSFVQARSLEGRPLQIVGGNTRSGFDLDHGDYLSSLGMVGIRSYDPGEMVITAAAGTPVSVIEQAASDANQYLAFEPIDYRGLLGTNGTPTIGGVFLSNSSGPARFVDGAARDHLLGLRMINGRGEVTRAGGRVMKNVTGLDLPKVVAGSRGGLAFVTEVTFKVLPSPETSVSAVLPCSDDRLAAEVMADVMRRPFGVNGAAYLPAGTRSLDEPSGAVVLRVAGLDGSVAERIGKLREALGFHGAIKVLGDELSRKVWVEIRDATALGTRTDRSVWRVSTAPTAGPLLVAALRRLADFECFYDWQGGLVWIAVGPELTAAALRLELRKVGGGHATLIRGGPDFEPADQAVDALSLRVKAAFDPNSVFAWPFQVRN